MDKQNLDQTLIFAIYQTVESRRQTYDTLMWQVPVISLTAQAFLFTIALGSTSIVARLISAILAFVTSIISIQLMSKHRLHEFIDNKLLEKLDTRLGLDTLFEFPFHARPSDRAKSLGIKTPWLTRRSSYDLWRGGLALFALASVVVIIVSLISPHLL